MQHSLKYFDIYPLVFSANSTAKITIKPLFDHVALADNLTIRIEYSPMLYLQKNSSSGWPVKENCEFKLKNGIITLHHYLEGEQEHGFALFISDSNGNETLHLSFNIYSLAEDMIGLRPYKGDFHIHSFCSDGKESPEYVTASIPRVGVDFFSLTDHGEYAPSLRAAKFAETVPTSLRVFPGEEVHLPDNPVHIINFGGSFSVNDLAKSSEANEAKYRKEVEERIKELSEDVPKNIRFQIASSEWAYDKIREGGGIAMFCHPYWRIRWRYNYISEECVNWMFKRAKFDVLELLGGYLIHESFSNNEQTARYMHEFAKAGGNPQWAIAGISDAHGCDTDLFGWFYTVLFAENCEFRSLKEAFKQKRSVAVKTINDECPEIYGDLRYVRYAAFLMKNFYPRHDALLKLESNLMLRHLAGEDGISKLMKTFPKRKAELYTKYWAE